MKKTLLVLALSLIIIFTISARPNIQTYFNLEYSFDTNIFSNPLPMYEEPVKDKDGKDVYPWLNWRAEHPFVKKHSIGGNMGIDMFIHDTDRVGFSAMLTFKVPLGSQSFKPVATTPAGFGGDWDYEKYDSLNEQKIALFGSFGPIFMAQFNKIDLGVSIRLSIGSYDYIEKEVIVGLQAEPFAHFYFNNHTFFNSKLTYDAHIMRFIDNKEMLFEPDYQMISLAPSFGIGVRF